MAQTTDPLNTLKALRPSPALDEDWSATTFAHIVASPSSPATERRPVRRRRRVVLSSVLAGALVSGGIGTAAANGDLSDRLLSLVGSISPSRDNAVPTATVHRAATAPGPDGRVFSVVTWEEAPGSDDDWCTAPLFEAVASAAGPAPDDFDENGAICGPGGLPNDFAMEYSVMASEAYAVYFVKAGAAVRGELSLPDGSTYPTVLVRGSLFGWFPSASDAALTGYAADGSVVGTVQLQPRR